MRVPGRKLDAFEDAIGKSIRIPVVDGHVGELGLEDLTAARAVRYSTVTGFHERENC